MRIDTSKIGAVSGGVLTVAVVGLLALFHTAQPKVDQFAAWTSPPDVRVCDDAPDWAASEVDDAVDFLENRGIFFGTVDRGPCVPCDYDGRETMCWPGGIAVDLRDHVFDDDHADETLRMFAKGQMIQSTVLLPGVISEDSTDVAARLPKNVDMLVLAHGLVHASGYAHTKTTVTRGIVAHKRGELMHPQVQFMGRGTAGLP